MWSVKQFSDKTQKAQSKELTSYTSSEDTVGRKKRQMEREHLQITYEINFCPN